MSRRIWGIGIPSYFKRRTRDGTQLSADGEDSIELAVRIRRRHLRRDLGEDSRLANAYVCRAILVAKLQRDRAELIEGTGVEAGVLAEGGKEEGLLVRRGSSFAWHRGCYRMVGGCCCCWRSEVVFAIIVSCLPGDRALFAIGDANLPLAKA